MRYDVWLWQIDGGIRTIVEADSAVEAARRWLDGLTETGLISSLDCTIAVRPRKSGRQLTERFVLFTGLRRVP